MLSSYLIKDKHVQVVMDLSSFTNTRSLQAMMKLPEMLYSNMKRNENDFFGLRTLNCTLDHQKYGHISEDDKPCMCLSDVITLEQASFNHSIK